MTIQDPAYRSAWFSWVALTLVGVELAMSIIYGAMNIDWRHPNISRSTEILLQVTTVAFAGTAFGASQWIWLRTRVYKAGWWIVITVVSWYCTLALFAVADSTVGHRYLDTSKPPAIL